MRRFTAIGTLASLCLVAMACGVVLLQTAAGAGVRGAVHNCRFLGNGPPNGPPISVQ